MGQKRQTGRGRLPWALELNSMETLERVGRGFRERDLRPEEKRMSLEGSEMNLLLDCIHPTVDNERRDQIASFLHDGIDWNRLLQKAHAHGTFPLLYRFLRTHFASLTPPFVMDQLRVRFLSNVRHSFLLTAELLKLLTLLEKNGVPAVPLKGPVLTVSLYGDLGMRPFDDLDLLFRKKDVPKAKEILISQGYRVARGLAEAPEAFFHQKDSGANLIRSDNQVAVDILWGMPGEFISPDFQPFWEKLEEISFEGRRVLTFSPEDWLLYLSLHQATHGWARLLWLVDLHTLITNHPDIDWTDLIGKSIQFRCRRVLLISLALTRSLFQTPLPEQVQEAIEGDGTIQDLARIAAGNLFQGESTALSRDQEALFLLKVMDNRRDQIRFGLRQALNPTVVDWLAWPLPRPLFFLYYFYHPLRVARNFFRRFRQRFYSTLPFLEAEIYPVQKSS
jgi:hypothetical protein